MLLDSDGTEITHWNFSAPFECAIRNGVVVEDFLYRDSSEKGIPTVGVGFACPSVESLSSLPWSPDLQAAIADWHSVMEQPPGRVASYYRQFCKARIPQAAIRGVFERKVDEIERQLSRPWGYEYLPEAAQIALVDIAYNIGVAGLGKFKKLRAAVLANDWALAAAESKRRERPAPNGIAPSRNASTRELFLSLLPGPQSP